MLRFLTFTLIAVVLSSPAWALSDKEFERMRKVSADFKKADASLNTTWKEVNRSLGKADKKFLLEMQREWVKNGRDIEAENYMEMGYTKECAYAKATRKWIANLRVYEYNAGLSQEDKDAGRIKADDAFWNEDDEDIPEHCRAEP